MSICGDGTCRCDTTLFTNCRMFIIRVLLVIFYIYMHIDNRLDFLMVNSVGFH